jgi:tetratricopeptide (TPR) repeat protein
LATQPILDLQRTDEEPEQLRLLFSSILSSNRFADQIAAAPPGPIDAPMPVVHFLGAALQSAGRVKGTRNLARVAFEDTDIAKALPRLRQYDAIVCASRWNARVLRDHGLAHVHVISEAVDHDLVFPAPRAGLFSRDRFHVFTGGEIGFRQGQDLTLLAFREFARRHDDVVLVTAWGGSSPRGSERFQGRLDAPLTLASDGQVDAIGWAAANGVDASRVIEVGPLTPALTAMVLREMDCALLPCRAEGGRPVLAMAAMACGLPVILSRNSGMIDLIDADNCAVLKRQSAVRDPSGCGTSGWGESDVGEILQTLEALYASADLRARIGANAARFMRTCTWADHAKALADLAVPAPPQIAHPLQARPAAQSPPGRSQADPMAQAIAHHQAGRLKAAEALYRQIARSGAAANLGGAHYNLAVILRERNDLEEAVMHFRRAAALRPDHARTFNNLGAALESLGRLDEAETSLRRALALQADYPNALYNLGNVLKATERPAEALAAYQRALALQPQDADAWSNAAIALQTMGRLDEAERHLRQALSLRPTEARLYDNLGVILELRGDATAALAAHQRALQLAPNLADAHAHIAHIQAGSGREDEAMGRYQRAIALDPGHAVAHNNLGLLHIERAEPQAAEALFARAAALKPDYADAQWNLGLARLLQGRFEAGWSGYEWRLRLKGAQPRPSVQPAWTGGDLAGRTILLTTEQGAGDAFQFIRYAPLVKALGAKVIIEAPPALAQVLATAKGVDAVITGAGPRPAFDCHAPLLSLPKLFNTTLATIPWDGPYLAADSRAVRAWRDRLASRPGLKAGVVWRGNPGHSRDRVRSMPAEAVAALAGTPNVALASLQLNASAEERAAAGGLEDLADRLTDWADTAALLQALDLVICVDTAVAHLAGALGRPVFLLLPQAPDWRWLLGRDDSPWYPSARLFRQPRRGDWPGAVEQVRQALIALAASQT